VKAITDYRYIRVVSDAFTHGLLSESDLTQCPTTTYNTQLREELSTIGCNLRHGYMSEVVAYNEGLPILIIGMSSETPPSDVIRDLDETASDLTRGALATLTSKGDILRKVNEFYACFKRNRTVFDL